MCLNKCTKHGNDDDWASDDIWLCTKKILTSQTGNVKVEIRHTLACCWTHGYYGWITHNDIDNDM